NLHAQLPDLPIMHDSLYSEVLKEGRRLEIVLPANYDPSSAEKYDVLYITDGEWNTRIVSNIRQFLNIQFIPENIIVSIPNVYPNDANQRGRDFTPTHTDGMPESGGADKFLSFIKTELLPYINKRYKTNSENTLYGSSLGGIFAMYALCREPQLFQSYLMADPAWWWDNNYISRLVKENLDKLVPLNKTVLITAREGAPYQYMGIAKVDSLLVGAKANGAHWKTMQYNDETHNAMIFRTVYDGLKYTYAGYAKEDLVIHPMHGLVMQNKSITFHINTELRKNVYFTTDGSTPVKTSHKLIADSFVLNGPGKLTVKSFSNREKYSQTITGNFKSIAAALPASGKPKNMQPGGLRYYCYEGTWDSLPDFKKLHAAKEGLANSGFNVGKITKEKNFACVLEGQLEIKTDGYYTFGLDAGGGAKLLMNNEVLIDYNGLHTSGKIQSFILPLVKGFYPVRIEYFQKESAPYLNLMYITPESNNLPKQIPAELEYSVKKM
ncbi:MAG: alpha/beta hydrolase-fold protein, partial [Bacteroidota bacterium]